MTVVSRGPRSITHAGGAAYRGRRDRAEQCAARAAVYLERFFGVVLERAGVDELTKARDAIEDALAILDDPRRTRAS
jgi:hypothetical protein